jgi:hypothetical protein
MTRAIIAALLLAPGLALACKCADELTDKQKFEAANTAFIGVVESAPGSDDDDGGEFKVRVTQALKGVKDGELITVSSPTSSCGIRLPKGRDVPSRAAATRAAPSEFTLAERASPPSAATR